MGHDFVVRPVRLEDWPAIEAIEQRWQKEGVAPLGRETFELWMRTHPQGFLAGVDSAGTLCAHSYCECIRFAAEDLQKPEGYKLFCRPYFEPHHDPAGNGVLILNVTAIPGSAGGVAVVRKIPELAGLWQKQWVFYLPRMPGLAAYYQSCLTWVQETGLDIKTVADYYAVQCMRAVEAAALPAMVERVRGLNLPLPKEPDPVLAKFVGRKLGAVLYEVIESGFPDPLSLNLAGLCVKQV